MRRRKKPNAFPFIGDPFFSSPTTLFLCYKKKKKKKNSFRHSFVNVLRSTGAFQRYRLEERENKEGKIENFIMTYCKVCAIVGSRDVYGSIRIKKVW